MTNYQIAKAALKTLAKELKNNTDKPYVRLMLNSEADLLCKDLNLTDYQAGLLALYVCKLHPKD